MPQATPAESFRLSLRKSIVAAAASSRVLKGAGAALILVAVYVLRLLRRRVQKRRQQELRGSQGWHTQTWNYHGSSWRGSTPGSANGSAWKGSWNSNGNGTLDKQAEGDDKEEETRLCWICKKPLRSPEPKKSWRSNDFQLNIRVRCCIGDSPQLCHFQCMQGVVRDCNASGDTHPEIDPEFKMEVRELMTEFYFLPSKQPCLQWSCEEIQLITAGQQELPAWPQPHLPAPPPACFALDGLVELRISACPRFCRLPAEVGLCRGLRVLVFISTGLTELPVEVGELKNLQCLYLNGNHLQSLPNAVGALPVLQEICLDANQLEVLPPITSPELSMFSVPANRLRELPMLASGKLERIEVHGNQLCSLPFSRTPAEQVSWYKMMKLKIMGNHIQELPREIGLMRSLRQLMVASNCLTTLPRSVAALRRLEWLFAYDNQISELPPSLLLGSGWLDRVLLEGNPLSVASTAALINDVSRSCVKTLGLDAMQIRTCEEGVTGWEVLPPCISVGSMVHDATASHYYMKLTRASQLRRKNGIPALGEPDGPALPQEAPARLLVVAFAASQGEPEWLGVLGRLAAARRASQKPVAGSFQEFLGTRRGGDGLTALWSGCGRNDDDVERESLDGSALLLEDFDVLSVVDHRMRWYAEDIDTFSKALAALAKPYECTLFVGASMGGFGAMLHCAHIASAVVVFGPQALLSTATLRPPAPSLEAHDALRERMLDSLRVAQARGVTVEVHCAADEHLGHALSLPLGDLKLTVHPLCPRKPFAKLLERVGLLTPIVAEVVARSLPPPDAPAVVKAHLTPITKSELPRIAVAQWISAGQGRCRMERHWATKTEVLKFFFNGCGPRHLPRPGDWFCPKCTGRNMSYYFWCINCKDVANRSLVSSAGVTRIPDGREYPRPGDWGCGKCGNALCAWNTSCTHCNTSRDDPKSLFAS